MPFFIKETRRFTYTKYLIEADTIEEADDKEGEYLGYVDADDPDAINVTKGPFTTKDEALRDDLAYTEGA